MVEQEEKRWLRALLEGEVEPGSEEWEQVCTDSACLLYTSDAADD